MVSSVICCFSLLRLGDEVLPSDLLWWGSPGPTRLGWEGLDDVPD